MRGYNEMKLSDGVFTIWNTSFDAARCVHMALGHTLACISCHGGMGSPLSAHWRRCQEDSDEGIQQDGAQ